MMVCNVPIGYVNAQEELHRVPCTPVLTYVRNERPLQRVQEALYDGLNGRSCSSGSVVNTQ